MSDQYQKLRDFMARRMRMSHIYQPAMLLVLLRGNGQASITTIAKDLLQRDVSQVEYYEQITKQMVGRVLARHGLVTREGGAFSLVGFDQLAPEEIDALSTLCIEKIDEYIERRGRRIWAHRIQADGYISGTLRYEVLKRAAFRCLLCGVSADEKALEVDHIVPRNLGGTDDISNLQTLCYSCNAMKRDRDNTDFRGVAASYKHRKQGCPFCNLPRERVVAENELCVAFRDLYPVTPLHTLVIPKRHVDDFFDLHQPEREAMHSLLVAQRREITARDPAVSAFNVGVNAGVAAGQTVFHCHMHLFPRRDGDCDSPRGGVRGIIPDKQSY